MVARDGVALCTSRAAGPRVASGKEIRHAWRVSRSGKWLALGFVVVLAGSVALWRVATRDEPGASVVHGPVDLPAPSAPSAVATTRARRSAPAIVASAVVPPDQTGIEFDASGLPIPVASLATLRTAAAATDDLARDCITKSGTRASGKVTVAFVVAGKSGIVATTSSGSEDEGSTIDNEALVECLHKTAFAMKFPPSKSPIAVWGRRRFVIENGVLAEGLVVEFGRIR